ncbi:MAG TPA: thiamine diphosphokinase [Candidatus Limnocylindria bacterium]|nr:thiamine diphosphokinase [Candidatus Limnocylindria bacterium]
MKAVVVAGGDADPADAAHLAGAELVIAADGGASFLDAVGARPDVLVGDLDSVHVELVQRLAADGVLVERHPTDKDATDAELALGRAVAAGATLTIVLGALAGTRLDHEVANLLLLADPAWAAPRRDVRMVRGATVVRALAGPGAVALEAAEGCTVSLLPLGGDAEGVRTAGLAYPLDGERLRFGRSRGLSNQVVGGPASVALERGVLLVIEDGQEDT